MGGFLRRAHRSAAPAGLPAWRRVRGSGHIAGAVAVLGVALSACGPAQAVTMPPAVGGDAAIAGSAGSGQAADPASAARDAAEAGSFRQIILPDLLIVAPSGLTAGEITRLGKIRGLRNVITFDGARIT